MEESKNNKKIEYKIYQIVCNETGEVYFGKTIKSLNCRLNQHKHDAENRGDTRSKQIILRNNYYIQQIDSTFDEKESLFLERYYIERFKCINRNVPGRNIKEYREFHKEYFFKYREENKEHISEYNKKYYEENKEHIFEKQKEKYTCECGSTIQKVSKSLHQKSKKHQKYINENS